jgi:hypothetical protein
MPEVSEVKLQRKDKRACGIVCLRALLREEGAKKSLLDILKPKPGYKLRWPVFNSRDFLHVTVVLALSVSLFTF